MSNLPTLYTVADPFPWYRDEDIDRMIERDVLVPVEPVATITVKGHHAVRTDQGWLRAGNYVVVEAVDIHASWCEEGPNNEGGRR